MKDEKELRKQILNSLPDKGESNAASFIKAAYIEKEEAKKKKKKKWWGKLAWATPVAAAILALVIVIPVAISNNSGVKDDPTTSESKSDTTPDVNPDTGGGGGGVVNVIIEGSKYEEAASSIESGILFLQSDVHQTTTLNHLLARPLYANRSLDKVSLIEHLEDVNPFLPTAEMMMKGEESKTTLTFEDGKEYPYTLTFEDGTVLSYKETRIAGKENDEEQYNLEGVCIIDGVECEVTGKREIETSVSESEYETEFTITLASGYSITIASENESEATETEQTYSYVYKNGRTTILEVELSYEVENNEPEMKIEVTTTGKEAEYLLSETTSGFSLHYEIEVSDIEYEDYLVVTIDEENALYIYSYSNGDPITSLPRA